RHLAQIPIRFEGHELRLRSGLNQLGKNVEGKADPGDNNGPTFHATVPVDTFFKWSKLEYFVDGELAFGLDFAFDGDSPRGSTEFLGIFCGLVLVDAE